MCLVSFIPIKDGFILSSNRDESPLRDAKEINTELINDELIYYPVDTKGGSWIFASNKDRLVCILNGAFVNHKAVPPYKMSRGVMCKDFFHSSNVVDFIQHYDFWGIEPFTMIIFDNSLLYEFRWDGFVKHVKELNIKSTHIWSSCTLYDHVSQCERENLLRNNLMAIDLEDRHSLLEAHLFRDRENLYNGLYMDRNNLIKTISHTQIIISPKSSEMMYYNIISNQKEVVSI